MSNNPGAGWFALLRPARNPGSAGRPTLAAVIERIRQRWRLRLLLGGLLWTLVLVVGVVLAAAWLVDAWHFSPGLLWTLRFITFFSLLALVLWFCIRPLHRQVDDIRVALYVEEHEPGLKSILLSAVDARRSDDQDLSPQLVEQLEARAIDACADIEFGDRVERENLGRASARLGLALLVVVGLALWPPAFLRSGAPAILKTWASASEISPYRIELAPGNTEVARGADQLISAGIEGFDGDGVLLFTSADGGASWQQTAMTTSEPGRYQSFLFDVGADINYYVTGAGRESPIYRLTVTDIPAVESISLRYHFPAYTMLSPETVDDTGDIAALRGTRVEVLIAPTIEIPGGALQLDDGQLLDLRRGDDGTWIGEITVQDDDVYRVILQRVSGTPVETVPGYRISVLDDQFPRISILSPGRDTKVSIIEEPVLEVRASDDQGIANLELVLSINGEDEQRISLMPAQIEPGGGQKIEAEHTVYLEDLGLRPGDLISYYVSADERAPADTRRTAISDMFFYQVRPFSKNYRRAQQQGGAGGSGGGGGEQQGYLSEQQKQFVIATFKMIRDRTTFSDETWRENLDLLITAQSRIRDRVQAIVRRIKSRSIVDTDGRYKIILDELPRAAEAMREVEQQLGETEIEAALTDAQVALKHLQRADAEFRDINVSLGNRGGGGGTAGNSGVEDLRNLFQLEMDKLRHQYDTVQHGARQQAGANDTIDEALEKLRELARRQQQEVERMLQRQGQAQSNDASREQLALAEELEQLARQLERLSREQPNQQLQQSARQMREAAEAMRGAAGEAGSNGPGGVEQARQAAENLRQARRLLDQGRAQQFGEQIERSLRRAELAERKQAEIRREVSGFDTERDDQFEARLNRLEQKKRSLSETLTELESELSSLVTTAKGEQPETRRPLRQAIRESRENRLQDRIGRTRQMLRQDNRQLADDNEAEIRKGIAQIRAQIEIAMANVDERGARRMERSLEQLRGMAQELRSMRDRRAGNGQNRGRASGGTGRYDGDGGPLVQPGELDNIVKRSQQLRKDLIDEGIPAGDIDPALARLEALARERKDTEMPAHDLALQALMELEYKLRNELEEPENPDLLVSEPSDVPDEYRDMVADYFRNLSRE